MAIQLSVTPEELRAAAGEVSALVQSLRGDFDALQQQVDRTRYYWLGGAGDHYRTGFAALRQDTQDILSRLAHYPPDLLEMAGIYTRTEDDNTDNITGLQSHFIR